MARPKKTEEVSKKEVIYTPVQQEVKETKQVETKIIEEKNKLKLQDFINTIFKGNKDEYMVESVDKNIITIDIPIVMASVWGSLIRGSAFSKMEINKEENVVRVWVLDSTKEPNIIIKKSLII